MKRTDSTFGLVGKWTEEENSVPVTPVIYTITMKGGHVHVTGIDASDGTRLRVSNIRWNGVTLSFKTFYPPTGHRAEHGFEVVGKRRARHVVSYSDDAGRYCAEENWKKMTR
jgi:hypothetical protein